MCLVVLAWNSHPRYKLVVAANRDEFYNRGTKPAEFWEDEPEILAGRDLASQGTWMGVSTKGKWTAITNYRDLKSIKDHAPSRGNLTIDFLKSTSSPTKYIQDIKTQDIEYNGYNLLVGDDRELFYFSNQLKDEVMLKPGIYGLSNHLLDTPWPKVVLAKAMLHKLLGNDELDQEALFGLLHNTEIHADDILPDTGIDIETERALSAIFIKMNNYGSRSSTVLLITHSNEVLFTERQYLNGEKSGKDSIFQFILG